MAGSPLSNRQLGGLFTLENVIVLGTTLVVIALSYGALSRDVDALQDERQTNADKISNIQHDISAVRTDVEVIKTQLQNTSEANKRQLERIERDRRRHEQMLEEILKEVKEQ